MVNRTFLFLRQLAGKVLLLCACLSLLSCTEDPPLKIGFVAGLTGRVADLGVASRDAVVFAIEEQNRAGGIAGRQLELVPRDDQQNDDALQLAIHELVDEQVVAIVGPMTSSMAVIAQPIINAKQIVMISPTVKTDQLSEQDDFFLRVTAPVSKNAQHLASYVTNELGLKRFAVVYDLSNRAFTEGWLNDFKKVLAENGGQAVAVEEFTSRPESHFLPIARRILAAEPDGILLLSNAIDTALMSQQIRKLESPVALFSSEWSSTTDLLSFGGRAVDGMRAFHSFNANSQEPRYLAFKEKFTERFGYVPSFATVLSYDAASFLFAGLASNVPPASLRETLLGLGRFQGLQSDMILNRYGDVERKLFLTVIDDGQFKVVD